MSEKQWLSDPNYRAKLGLNEDGTPTPERAAFEEWYVTNAFDYATATLGSRDCGLQWKAWQAAQISATEVERNQCWTQLRRQHEMGQASEVP